MPYLLISPVENLNIFPVLENAKKNLESGYKIDVTESIQNAEKHFEKLDEFLNN